MPTNSSAATAEDVDERDVSSLTVIILVKERQIIITSIGSVKRD
jgi:hypothetical protein